VTRAALVAIVLLAGRVASAGPDGRPTAAPPPDGSGPAKQSEPADKRRIVGVLEVRVDGVPDEVKESFQRGLENQVNDKHYFLASRARMKQSMMRSTKWTEGCIVGQCLGEVRAQTGADLVLLAAITGSGGSGTSFGYVVTLVRTDNGRVMKQVSDRCDVCTVNEAIDKATRATIDLLGKVPDKLPDEAAEQSATLDVAVGKVTDELTEHRRHTSRVGVGLALVGAGVLVTGAALYAFDSKTYAAVTASSGAALALGGLVVLTF
jgi:hypothetical protein